MKIVFISIFGVLGVLARYSIQTYWGHKSEIFPVSTFFINILGCFIAGFIYGQLQHKQMLTDDLSIGIMIGFCGGFTTFSGYCLQSLNIMQTGEILKATAYIVLSIVLGLWMILLGVKSSSYLPRMFL